MRLSIRFQRCIWCLWVCQFVSWDVYGVFCSKAPVSAVRALVSSTAHLRDAVAFPGQRHHYHRRGEQLRLRVVVHIHHLRTRTGRALQRATPFRTRKRLSHSVERNFAIDRLSVRPSRATGALRTLSGVFPGPSSQPGSSRRSQPGVPSDGRPGPTATQQAASSSS